MSSAEKNIPKYSVADYQHWQGNWELWEGSPISMSPSPSGTHGSVAVRLGAALLNATEEANCEASVMSEVDWIVSDDTIVKPDVSVVCGAPPETHIMQPPAIVAEVLSPGTRNNDLGFKRKLYEAKRVPWYFVLDPETMQLTVLQLNSAGQHEEVSVSGPLKISICDQCNLAIATDRLFG